jgi:hypothetical protein
MDDTPYTTSYVREPRDEAQTGGYADLYRDREEFTGAPIVVHTDPETLKRWVVSDPHRHAAALRAGVEPETVELTEVFREAGSDYFRALGAARDRGQGVIPEEVFVGGREWLQAVLERLPGEVRGRYWTEPGQTPE